MLFAFFAFMTNTCEIISYFILQASGATITVNFPFQIFTNVYNVVTDKRTINLMYMIHSAEVWENIDWERFEKNLAENREEWTR